MGNMLGSAVILLLGAAVTLGLSALAAWGWNLGGLGRHLTAWQVFGLAAAAFSAFGIYRLFRAFFGMFDTTVVSHATPDEEEEGTETETEYPPVFWVPRRQRRKKY
jgi:hypothetical protein